MTNFAKKLTIRALFLFTLATSLAFLLATYQLLTSRYRRKFVKVTSYNDDDIKSGQTIYRPYENRTYIDSVSRKKTIHDESEYLEDLEATTTRTRLLHPAVMIENSYHLKTNTRDKKQPELNAQKHAKENYGTKLKPYTYRGDFPVGKLEHLRPKNRYIKHRMMGRLGNVMFQLASVYCVAQRYNFSLIFSYRKEIVDLAFLKSKRVTVLILEDYKALPLYITTQMASEDFCCSFDSKVLQLFPNTSYGMRGYFQSWKYFEPCKANILEVVSFNKKEILRAEGALKKLRIKFPNSTLVGIHIRMEDQARKRDFLKGRKIAPPEYYLRAMTYFRNKFRDVIFLAMTSLKSQAWFRANVSSASDVIFVPRSESAAVDMEVLSGLDHLIISVGTFGWWAGYKNRGTVVCYKDFFVPGSKFGRQFLNNGLDYLYPLWIAM